MIAVTVVRISGAKLLAARKNPNSTQIKPCHAFSPACRCSSHTTTPSTRTSDSEMANAPHRPPGSAASLLAVMIASKRSAALPS